MRTRLWSPEEDIMKKSIVILVVIALLGIVIYSQRTSIVERIMARGLETRMGLDVTDDFEDGLHLALCGAGGPMPAPKASGPCVAVVAGDRLFVVDAGTDGVRNLGRMGYPVGDIEAVFLTHFHSDHMDGLGELATIRWVSAANTTPLPVHGPEGVHGRRDRGCAGLGIRHIRLHRQRPAAEILDHGFGFLPVSYTHLTLPTTCNLCRSRWSPYH